MRGEIPQTSQYDTAEIFSLDGVVFSSRNPFPFEKAAENFKKSPMEYIPPSIEHGESTPHNLHFLPVNQIKSFIGQFACSVTKDMWQYLWSLNADVYGNTGRPDIPQWRNLTEDALSRGEVGTRFKGIFYKPNDIEAVLSKRIALQAIINSGVYTHIHYYDNSPWVVFGLARVIPEASFVLVQDPGIRSKYKYSQEQVSQEFGDRVTVTDTLTSSSNDPQGVEHGGKQERVIYSYFEERKKQLKRTYTAK